MNERHEPSEQDAEGKFDFNAWMLERRTNPNYFMVEFGHGPWPAAFKQTFEQERAYVGIEEWRRGKREFGEKLFDTFNAEGTNNHVMFIDHPDPEDENFTYTAETVLPDAVADEVFLANVFGDPQVAKTGTHELMQEAVRLLADNGTLVIRETITPHHAQIDEELLAKYGLKLQAAVQPVHTETWEALEEEYFPLHEKLKELRAQDPEHEEKLRAFTGLGDPNNPDNFYLILKKIN